VGISEVAEIAALAGALGAVLVLVPRGRVAPLVGFVLLGLATAAIAWSLVGTDDVKLLFGDARGAAMLVGAAAGAVLGAALLARYPAVVPVVFLAVAPFRVPVQLGADEAFLLLPLYAVLTSAVLALGYRLAVGKAGTAPPLLLALPVAAFVVFTSTSYLWTWDERQGGIVLAFFTFPFVAGLATIARAPVASWLPRTLFVTLAALGSLFAAIGIWQAHTRTVFFARDVEVANAYTTWFRVTSLFKDPSMYGRYLVLAMTVLLVLVLVRRGRTLDWVAATAVLGFLFWGLYYSYSQSSFVALFVVTFGIAVVGTDRRTRVILAAGAAVAMLAAAAAAGAAIGGHSARDVTSGRSRLVSETVVVVKKRPIAGVGVGGQPQAAAELLDKRSSRQNASHTTPITVLAEVGIIGFVLYVWLLGAAGRALYLVAERSRTLGIALGALLLALFVHSLFYAGFFEDPLMWGVLGVAAAVLSSASRATHRREGADEPVAPAPNVLAH
jgi:hypothetical protein